MTALDVGKSVRACGTTEINKILKSRFHAVAQEDWEVIFGQTGFKLAKVYPTRSLFSVVEAVGI